MNFLPISVSQGGWYATQNKEIQEKQLQNQQGIVLAIIFQKLSNLEERGINIINIMWKAFERNS